MNNVITTVLKSVALVLFDLVSLILFFSVWALVNIPIFPNALFSVLISLFLLNLVVLFSKIIISNFGLGVYVSALIVTLIYYVFIYVFTWTSYIVISPKWYIVTILGASIVYLSILTGLYIAGHQKGYDISNQNLQSQNTVNLKLHLMNIKNQLICLKTTLDKEDYASVLVAFNEMEERLLFSTPFGRSTEPIAINMEQGIIDSLLSICNEVNMVNNSNGQDADVNTIIKSMNDVKNTIANREKLLVK